jgi:hypothetical protein
MLRYAVLPQRFVGILGGRHMECAFYFDYYRLSQSSQAKFYSARRSRQNSTESTVYSARHLQFWVGVVELFGKGTLLCQDHYVQKCFDLKKLQFCIVRKDASAGLTLVA